MANHLKMHVQDSIAGLYRQGWSRRRIARELGIHRGTVNLHVAGLEAAGISKPASVATGSGKGSSTCEGHREWILGLVEAGLSAERIWQDLVGERGFAGSRRAVRRYVQRLKAREPHRVWRMESLPGEEVQVDFCTGWWLVDEHGRRRKVQVLRMVLSHSRKGYSEAVLRQDTESFLRAMENGFRAFGGVPATVNLDNLKAGVLRADWYEPELNPKLEAFARHYGTVLMPTRPRRPEHKGKVENAVGYVEGNGLKGRRFTSLAALNEHLRGWEAGVADLRIHGTTRQQVRRHFLEVEQPRLKALPDSLFPCYREGPRQVHRDSFVEVERAYYEVPCEYIGRRVWAQWDARMVRVFNERRETIATHARLAPGTFSRVLGIQGRAQPTLEESQRYWIEKVARLGPHVQGWAEAILEQRGILGLRVVQGLVGLSRRYEAASLDAACEKALLCGQWRLRELRGWLLDPQLQPQTFSFLESHPLIRDMDAYALGASPFEEQPQTPIPQNS